MPAPYKYRIRQRSFGDEIFCESRGIWVALTPEESVRQQFIRYMVVDVGYQIEHIAVEQAFTLEGGKSVRADIVVYDKNGNPKILVECKAPSVGLDIEPFRQASKYNRYFKANYMVLTNGKIVMILHTIDFISYNSVTDLPNP